MLRRIAYPLALILLAASWVEASPLRLDYSKSWSSNGIVYYTFTLALENADESWEPGQGWGWLIFGDSPYLGGSPFNDFTMTGHFGVGPWSDITTSSGAHNGPTLGPLDTFWVPNNVGEFLTWQGYSTSNVPDGGLYFSTFFTQGGAVAADFETANNLFPDDNFPNSPAYVPPATSSLPPSSNSSSSSSSSSGGSCNPGVDGCPDPFFIQTLSIPEPGTVGLMALALLMLGWRKRA